MNVSEANALATVVKAISALPEGVLSGIPDKAFQDAYYLAVRADKTLQAGNLPRLVIDARNRTP